MYIYVRVEIGTDVDLIETVEVKICECVGARARLVWTPKVHVKGETVSYTHLDVYKRQIPRWRCQIYISLYCYLVNTYNLITAILAVEAAVIIL